MCARAYVKNTATYAFPTCDRAGGGNLRFSNLRSRRRRQPTLSQPAIAQEERQPHPLKSVAAHKFHTRGAGSAAVLPTNNETC